MAEPGRIEKQWGARGRRAKRACQQSGGGAPLPRARAIYAWVLMRVPILPSMATTGRDQTKRGDRVGLVRVDGFLGDAGLDFLYQLRITHGQAGVHGIADGRDPWWRPVARQCRSGVRCSEWVSRDYRAVRRVAG